MPHWKDIIYEEGIIRHASTQTDPDHCSSLLDLLVGEDDTPILEKTSTDDSGEAAIPVLKDPSSDDEDDALLTPMSIVTDYNLNLAPKPQDSAHDSTQDSTEPPKSPTLLLDEVSQLFSQLHVSNPVSASFQGSAPALSIPASLQASDSSEPPVTSPSDLPVTASLQASFNLSDVVAKFDSLL